MTATIAERVAAGAIWLDERAPGWVDRIDLDRLDLTTCRRCVLGQVFGNYLDAPLTGYLYNRDEHAMELGFEQKLFSGERPALTAAWRQLIEARRAER